MQDIDSPMQRRKLWRLPVVPWRHRARRVARDRVPSARHLRERRLAGARRERRESTPRSVVARSSSRSSIAIGFALLLFKVGPALLTTWLPIDSTGPLRRRRGADPRRCIHRLHPRDLAAAGSPPRLPVPRRGAQGDQRARSRRRADAAQRAEVQLDSPALRYSVFALGNGDRDLRLRVRGRRTGTG